jgi:PleD family two-component response regulator
MFDNFFSEHPAVYDIMRKNMVQPARPQMATRRTGIAYRIPKATNTHSHYVTLAAFARQQCLSERS